ncbi:MAG: TonB-dependent receptor plug domain-containing protein [Ignavibacteriales bacterium]|nr:TonB-dependent receptor plug domain-containing protein [Ignavibacteriales bacterium]
MYKKILLLLFIFVGLLNAQSVDSTNNKINIFPDSSFAKTDSLLTNDSLLVQIKPDSIAPIYSTVLTSNSFVISNNDLLHNDYKYAGDYLRLFPFNFIKDLGFTGQPNETFLYGVGDNSISYLMDGISINDRYSNSFNLNLIQSEAVDSVEVISLPRGFLYGNYSNPVSVNFITKDFVSIQPYTRIRFYQGANRNMMFDGSFNARVTNRLIASFNITNRILDETYDATEYSIWQGKFRLKYLLSNYVNIIASYNINDYKAGYSGGVDVDSIIASGEVVNEVMYSSLDNPPMFFPEGKLNSLTHLPRLRVLATPTYWLKTDASVFYLYNESEFVTRGSTNSETKTFGINIRNDAEWNLLKLQINADYEKSRSSIYSSVLLQDDSTYINSFNEVDENIFSLSGIVSAYIYDSTFIPSVFFKTSEFNRSEMLNIKDVDFSRTGYGYDLTIKLNTNINFYAGASVFDGNLFNELGAKYNNDFLKADLKYFSTNYSYGYYTGGMFFNYYQFGKVSGLGINLKLNHWKLLLESNNAYYSSKSTKLNGVSEFQTQTGLYYKDILFDNNLDLKTGFVFYFTGKNNVFTYENVLVEVPSSNKLDFTLVGEIQKTAIVYFTWQNLLGSNYYLTPYYPMPGRSLRFGVVWEMFN